MASISLGLDLEVICEDQRFFKILTNRWPGKVCIVICHNDTDGVARDLGEAGIRADRIFPVHNHEDLLKVIADNGIAYYYQCNDTIIELPQSLKVFRMHTAWKDVEGYGDYYSPIETQGLSGQPDQQRHCE